MTSDLPEQHLKWTTQLLLVFAAAAELLGNLRPERFNSLTDGVSDNPQRGTTLTHGSTTGGVSHETPCSRGSGPSGCRHRILRHNLQSSDSHV